MQFVADYKVISDDPVTLKTGSDIDKDFSFDLGTDVDHNQYVILQFFYVSLSDAKKLNYQFLINGKPVRKISVTGNHFATIHEVARNVTKDHLNQLTVRIVGGSGTVKISDIVLWIQRSV